ncbi:DUF6147 family protein [Tepidibacter thalassicus]|uniref:Uncharacterized protein n=1 Tax=Tepidibacter thalassicus DSM 15285 TaxID=1123350 RepID=A0A1M5SUJ6_9FIRM|nr:DUF6147 family protein [Tepidibacter thalassicus]SHH42184.1 hypothetical protein SAMN02744040_01917 [Tepidibacter thalassicus DSM 15285]
MKKIVSLFICTICFLSFSLVSFGEDSDIHRSEKSNEYLCSSVCRIDLYKNNKLEISGYTESLEKADTISIKIYLQKYDKKSRVWRIFRTVSASEKNSDFVICSKTYKVTPGLYRAKAYHSLKKGSTKESERNSTKIIEVN